MTAKADPVLLTVAKSNIGAQYFSKTLFQEEDLFDVESPLHSFALHGDKANLKKFLDSIEPSTLEAKDKFGRTPLIYSVMGNNVECASILLKCGARVDNSDNCGQTALHWAAHKSQKRCARLLLENGALWHQKDINGVTPLHLAARASSPKCIEVICKEVQRGQLDIEDSNKRTPVHWSAAFGNAKHIKILLKKGANIGIPDTEGKTPLHLAASCSQLSALECVKILVEEAPSTVIDWQDYEGRTALHLAIAWGSTDIVDVLTATERRNFNALDNMFCTPLHWAAYLGLTDKVSLLLDRQAEPYSADINGATPLHYAAQGNHADTMAAFLSRSYISDKGDAEGRCALIWAAAQGANAVIDTMNTFGIDLSVSDKNGITALHAAASQGNVTTIDALLDLGAPLEVQDKAGMTPFLHACEKGKAKSVRLLIERGAIIMACDVDGRNSLHWAALRGHAYVCQILLQNGCDPNSQDFYGKTPLHYTSHQGFVNCTSVLLTNNADSNISDNEGKTPLHVSCSKGHLDVVKLLYENGGLINVMAAVDGRCTPLDCAMLEHCKHVEQFLREQDALTSLQIKWIAAVIIQALFRSILTRRNLACQRDMQDFSSDSLLPKEVSRRTNEDTIYSSSTDKRASKRDSCCGSSDSEYYQSSIFQSSFSSFSKSIEMKEKSKIPIATWRISEGRFSNSKSLYSSLLEYYATHEDWKYKRDYLVPREDKCVTHCFHCCMCQLNLLAPSWDSSFSKTTILPKCNMKEQQCRRNRPKEIIVKLQNEAATVIQKAWKRYKKPYIRRVESVHLS